MIRGQRGEGDVALGISTVHGPGTGQGQGTLLKEHTAKNPLPSTVVLYAAILFSSSPYLMEEVWITLVDAISRTIKVLLGCELNIYIDRKMQ